MVKKLLAFLFLSIPLFGQLVDLTQTKGTLPTARLITGTITPLACLGLSADGLTVISVACGGGGGGTITGSGTANNLTKWTSSTAIGNGSIVDNGTSVVGTLPMSNTTTGQTVSYTLPSSGGAATANFLVRDTNTATSGTDRGFSIAKTWNPSGSSTEGGRAADISWTVPSSNSQSFTNLALSGLNIHGVFSGTGTLSGGCLTCGVHAILAENYTASGNAIVVDAISLFNGPTTGFAGTTSNNDGLFVRSGAFGTAAGTISSNTGITVSAACAQSGATPTTTCTNSYGIFLTPMGAISGSNPNPWQIFDNSAGAGMAASSANKSQLGQVFANSYDIYGTTSGSVSLQPSSATASGTISVPNGTGTLLVTHAANTGAAGMTLNMSASTSAASLRVPNIAGASSTTAGVISYDTTNKNFHAGANGVDNFMIVLPSSISPANNDCAKFTVAAGVVTLNTAGAACGVGSGVTSLSGDGTIITNSASTGAVTLTIAGTSGGIPYFNSTSAWTSSALLTSNSPMLGGGAGNPPKTVAGITSDGTSAVTFGVQNTSQGKLTVTGSAAANGQLVLNIAGASANALTITPGANAGGVTLTGPTTGGTIPSTATAPVALSAAGAISITGAAGQVLGGSGPAFTATPTLGVQNTTQGTLTVTGSAASAGQLILNIAGASANALTITPGANAGGVTLTGPTTGGTIPSAATAPVTLSAAGAIACATCATTTNGGAISGTAPVAVSAAGAISITGAAGQVLAGAGPAFTATPTLGVQNTTQGTLTVAGSAAANGQLILNIAGASANALTITPGANAGGVTLTGPTTGGTIPSTATAPVTLSAAGAIACATCVVNNAANTGTTAMTLDMSASTTANAFKVPIGAGLTSGADGVLAYDSTAKLTHQRTNSADSISMASTGTSTTTTQAVFATAVAGIYGARAIATGDLPNIPINQVVSATGAITTIADGNNPLVINCALTSGTTCLTTGETTAATTAGAVEHQVTTLTTSTAIALQLTQGAAGPANAAAPNIITVSVAAAGGASSASNAGSNGAAISLLTGAGSAGGATTGIGGNGGTFTVVEGIGGAAGGTATNNGGNGGGVAWTTGAGGAGGSGAATAGSGGNFTVTLGAPGANSNTGTLGVMGQFNVTGNAAATTSNTTGVSAGTIFSVSGVAGGADSAAAGTAGTGSTIAFTGGIGGAGTGTNTVGGTGGAYNVTTGAGGASAGTGANANGGNATFTMGIAGIGGSGTAGVTGQFKITGTAPASSAGTTGLSVGTLVNIAGVIGGADSNAAGTAGVGSIVSINSGAGGAGTSTNTVGGAGGAINLTAGNGGASAGTGINAAGGNIVLTPGTAGTGGSSTAGAAGNVQIAAGTVGGGLAGSFLNITGTWNTTGVVDAALFMNITNSGSGAASKLADFQVGSVSQWNLDKAGNTVQLGSVTAGSGAATAGALVLGQGTTQSTGTTNITLQAPTSVTSHVLTLPGVKATNNNSAMLFSNAAPSVAAYAKMQQTAITSGTAYSNATTTFSDVKGGSGQTLSFSVEASTNYVAHCYIQWQGSASTTGPKFQFTGPASPTNVSASMFSTVTATTFITASATAFSSAMANSGTITTATNFISYVDLGLVNGVNAGTVTLQAAANGAGTLTINDGSFCVLQ